jgi:hypothetical protein
MFLIVVALVIVVCGGFIYINKDKNKPAADTSNQAISDDNNARAGTNDATKGESTDYKVKLAKFLTQKGMVLYGAYWCPHCRNQKEMFGDAFQFIDYVECDAGGPNGNPEECKAKGIDSYPTWIYQGQKYPGEYSLSELAKVVGFTDSEASQSSDNSNPPANSGDNQQ